MTYSVGMILEHFRDKDRIELVQSRVGVVGTVWLVLRPDLGTYEEIPVGIIKAVYRPIKQSKLQKLLLSYE